MSRGFFKMMSTQIMYYNSYISSLIPVIVVFVHHLCFFKIQHFGN
jgi:hypothetical protein